MGYYLHMTGDPTALPDTYEMDHFVRDFSLPTGGVLTKQVV